MDRTLDEQAPSFTPAKIDHFATALLQRLLGIGAVIEDIHRNPYNRWKIQFYPNPELKTSRTGCIETKLTPLFNDTYAVAIRGMNYIIETISDLEILLPLNNDALKARFALSEREFARINAPKLVSVDSHGKDWSR